MNARESQPPHTRRAWHARVWQLAGPIILANISVPLVGVVDTAVVGHLPDPVYIGAVALGAIIFNFVFWVFGFLRMGTSGFVAQAWGASNGTEIRALAARAAFLALLLGTALVLLQWPIAALSFALLDSSAALEQFAREYFTIRIWAAPATLMNYALLGCLIGMQNTRGVLLVQLCLNLSNMALDLLFVVGFDWGVGGVALASVISEYLALLLGVFLMYRQLRTVPGHFGGARELRLSAMRELLTANANIMIRTLCLVLAFFLFTAKGTELGELTLAANAILLHLLHITAHVLDGFATAAEALIGQAIGERNRAALRRAIEATSLWALVVSLLLSILFLAMGEPFIGLVTDIEPVRHVASEFLPWIIAMPVVSVWSYQLDGLFIGATRTAEMRNAMVFSLLCYIGLMEWLILHWGNHGLWAALLLFTSLRALSLAVYYPRLGARIALAD